tara:strand:+ start:159 stop:617 length:459 start_codon:yes stop_codon:yes gene_type:complete
MNINKNKLIKIDSSKQTNDSNILIQNKSQEIKEKGEEILENHDFFKDLSELMENDKFSIFFDKYFTNMNESKITLVYMKLYKEFKEKWVDLRKEELDKRINVFLLWRLMRDKDINNFVLHTIINKMEGKNKNDVYDDLTEFIKLTDKSFLLK